MKKDDRTAIYELVEGLIIIIILGATLDALYEAPWGLYINSCKSAVKNSATIQLQWPETQLSDKKIY